MFSKASKPTKAPALPESLPQSSAPVSVEGPRTGVPSIISADLKIVGDLHSGGDLQIDGAVEGDITSRSLTIGESAVVRGVLVAETVRIYGSVIGEVRANSVTLSASAKVAGDISHQSLVMEAGADLIGRLSRLDAKIGTAKPAEPAAPTPKSNGSGIGAPDTTRGS
jgi:cytoskeletal protein CcmA (bactofilin family)